MRFSRAARRIMADAEAIVRRLLHTEATVHDVAAEYGMKRPDAVLRVYHERTTAAQRRAAHVRKLSGPLNAHFRPVGTVVIEKVRGKKPRRLIKVAETGPKDVAWRPYAVWLWERDRGRVPAGWRVMHRDGDTLNDNPSNLVCLSHADAAVLSLRAGGEQGEAKRIEAVKKGRARSAVLQKAANDARRRTSSDLVMAAGRGKGVLHELSRRTGILPDALSRVRCGRRILSESERVAVGTAVRDMAAERPLMTIPPRTAKDAARRNISRFLAGLEAAA